MGRIKKISPSRLGTSRYEAEPAGSISLTDRECMRAAIGPNHSSIMQCACNLVPRVPSYREREP